MTLCACTGSVRWPQSSPGGGRNRTRSAGATPRGWPGFMSALRRPGAGGEAGYGYYGEEPAAHRGPPGGPEPAQPWGQPPPPGYYQQRPPPDMGNGWGEPGRARAQQEQPYPGYNPGYWNSSGPPRPSYPSTYPVGPEMQGQGMESYTNGGYGSQYAPAPPGVMNQPYPNVHPSNPFYSSGQPQASYSSEPTSAYKSSGSVPASAPQWSYPPQQSCQNDCPSHRGQAPGYPPFSTHHQVAGMPAPSYPYAEATPGIPHQGPPQPRPQEETWSQQGAYGMPQPPQHYWPPASTASHAAPGNPFIAGSTSSWSSNGVPPPSYDAKEPSYPSSYSKPEQVTNHSGYYPEPSTHNMGTIQDKPTPVNPKSHYSASPQLYDNGPGPRKEPASQDAGPNSVNSHSSDNLESHPGIQKIVQVLEKVQYLDNEVEEFVGRKTDKSYKLLEELLTKELLELDSVETGGLDSIRQARKEAVRKLQAILEKLERKGL